MFVASGCGGRASDGATPLPAGCREDADCALDEICEGGECLRRDEDGTSPDVDAGGPGCPEGLPGPALVEVPTPQGDYYCMDATEVTNRHYDQFLADKGSDVTGQDPWCDWNTSYTTDVSFFVGDDPDEPVLNVDWCDAYAYCKWAGKHLCGKIGGGSVYPLYASDATQSEWFNACSEGGRRAYSYGDEYVDGACSDSIVFALPDEHDPNLLPVGSKPTCEGGYLGLFDLSGNAAEWEDSCIQDSDWCRVRGVALVAGVVDLRCDSEVYAHRGDTFFSYSGGPVGVRCCAATL